MMGVTHRPFGAAWWLGSTLVVDVVLAPFGAAGINPVVAAAGALVAPVFAAGRWSPDADVTWLARFGHRQATHRPDTTAAVLTGVTFVLWLPLAVLVPGGLHWLAWAPVAGWWSHLAGDSVFGRIPLGARAGAVLAPLLAGRHGVDGKPVLIRAGGRQAYWLGLGFDTDGLLERGNRLSDERDARGLRVAKRGLWFAPTTVACRAAVVLLLAAHAAWWMAVAR